MTGADNHRSVFYGRLDHIIECVLPEDEEIWGQWGGRRLLLAVIASCRTGGRDAAVTKAWFKKEPSDACQVVVDLRTVQSVVGRVWTQGRWGVVDRSSKVARTVFVDEDGDEAS